MSQMLVIMTTHRGATSAIACVREGAFASIAMTQYNKCMDKEV